MNCKNCGNFFHYCNSCDREFCYEEGYCSDKCLKESDEFKYKLSVFKQLGFTQAQLNFLEEIGDDYLQVLKEVADE